MPKGDIIDMELGSDGAYTVSESKPRSKAKPKAGNSSKFKPDLYGLENVKLNTRHLRQHSDRLGITPQVDDFLTGFEKGLKAIETITNIVYIIPGSRRF